MSEELHRMDDSAHMVERIGVATRRSDDIADFGSVTDNLASRCLDFVRQRDLEGADVSIPLAFLGYLGPSSEVFPDVTDREIRNGLREALDACLGRYDHELRDVSALLLGRAASAALVQELKAASLPADTHVSQLFQLCEVDPLAYDVLTAAVERALKEGDRVSVKMLAYLAGRIDEINLSPGKFVWKSEDESFYRYVMEWRETPSIIDLWRGSGEQFLPNFGQLDFINAALRAVPAETLRVLDQLRFPQPLDWILTNGSVRRDRDRMTELIRLAPSSLESDGLWNGSILALLLLKEADNHCRDLWRTAHKNAGDLGETRELIYSWLKRLAAVVVSRSDGTFLSTQWLRMKSADERVERGSRDKDGLLPQLEMVGWLGRGLAEAGLRGRDIERRGSLRPNDRASGLDDLASMAVLDQVGDSEGDRSQAYLSRLDGLLRSRDPSFEVEATFDIGLTGFVDSSIGHLLATAEDCPERWRRSWNLLVEQRRRVLHWPHTKDSDAIAPSLFLVRVGLAALDWLCSEASDHRHVAEALWQTMFQAVCECWLTVTVTHLVEPIERDIGRLFSRHPAVFGAKSAEPDSNRPYSQRLADDLGALGGDDVLMARCCELASRNLHDQRLLHDALRRNAGRGCAVLAQFLRWQDLERRVKKQPQLRQAVERILADMG